MSFGGGGPGDRGQMEATTFVELLAAGRAREVPSVLLRSTHLAWRRRWDEDAGSVLQPLVC